MTSALGCRIADRLAAIAPNGGLRAGRPDPDDLSVPDVEDCRPDHPLPVLAFHGQQDVVNPYLGNAELPWGYTEPLAVQTWARLNECRRGPVASPPASMSPGSATPAAAAAWKLSSIASPMAATPWPGSSLPHVRGLVTQEIDASRIMWEFFADLQLPRR